MLNRIDDQNDPVDAVDPWGLVEFEGCSQAQIGEMNDAIKKIQSVEICCEDDEIWEDFKKKLDGLVVICSKTGDYGLGPTVRGLALGRMLRNEGYNPNTDLNRIVITSYGFTDTPISCLANTIVHEATHAYLDGRHDKGVDDPDPKNPYKIEECIKCD